MSSPTPACPRCGTSWLDGTGHECPFCREPVPTVEVPQLDSLPAPDAPLPDPPVDAAGDDLFVRTLAALREPERPRGGFGLVLLITLAAFFLAESTENALLRVAIVCGVIVFHEMGHFLGMKLFGYRDLKMFFVPFLGAAVSGKSRLGAPQWQRAIVLLLGPLPGILVGCGLLLGQVFIPDLNEPWARDLTWMLIGLNVFNLLPLGYLDGGQLLNLLIFSRHRALEAVFVATSSLLLILLAIAIQAYLLTILGVLGLLGVFGRYRINRAAEAFRQRWSLQPVPLAEAPLGMVWDLFEGFRPTDPKVLQSAGLPKLIATQMGEAYERALTPPMPIWLALPFLAVYGGCWIAPVFTAILVGALR